MILNIVRDENVGENEKLVFSVICGDFNFDNLSPCDQVTGQNEIFSQYYDIAAEKVPGKDKVRFQNLIENFKY